jgi:hypothetical protein
MAGRPKQAVTDNEKDLLIGKLRREIANLKRNPVSSFIKKKPDYHYSLSGFYIVRKWIYYNGLTAHQLEVLVVISHYEYFLKKDLLLWNLDHGIFNKAFEGLLELGYIIPVSVPGQRYKTRKGWALTQKGRDVEKDYEKFYDEKMHDLINKTAGEKSNTKSRFEDGQYFRRVHKKKGERRAEQGGGMLPRNTQLINKYKDAYPNVRPNDEQA